MEVEIGRWGEGEGEGKGEKRAFIIRYITSMLR